MYDQVTLPPAEFAEWLVERGVAVLHLVRGATLLRPSPTKREARLTGVVARATKRRLLFRITSRADAEKIQAVSKKLHLNATGPSGLAWWRHWVQAQERSVGDWRKLIAADARVWSHELRYEQLLGPHKRSALTLAKSFLQQRHDDDDDDGDPLSTPQQPSADTNLPRSVRVHKRTCSDRIADWPTHRVNFIGTETLRACDALDLLTFDNA